MNQTFKLPSLEPWKHWDTMRLRKEMAENPRAFARGYQMRAFNDDERMFPSFKTCYEHAIVIGDVARRGYPVFVGVDLAGARRPGTVIFVLALEPTTQRRIPLEILIGAWTSPETAKQIAGVCQRHANIRYVMVENNGYQQALIDWVRSSPVDHSFWYKIEAFTTGQNKNASATGLPSLEVEFTNKAWSIPASEFQGHPVTCACGWCTWVQQMTDYPMGAQDDSVMAAWFAREAIARWGGSTQLNQMASIGDINMR